VLARNPFHQPPDHCRADALPAVGRAGPHIEQVSVADPAYYRVPTGKKFEFDIDYSKLAKDPNADKSAAGYLYAPGNPVAVWA
jgi:hypothetical protein